MVFLAIRFSFEFDSLGYVRVEKRAKNRKRIA